VREAQNGCRGNTGIPASAPRTVQFMVDYIKYSNVNKLQNRLVYSSYSPGEMT